MAMKKTNENRLVLHWVRRYVWILTFSCELSNSLSDPQLNCCAICKYRHDPFSVLDVIIYMKVLRFINWGSFKIRCSELQQVWIYRNLIQIGAEILNFFNSLHSHNTSLPITSLFSLLLKKKLYLQPTLNVGTSGHCLWIFRALH